MTLRHEAPGLAFPVFADFAQIADTESYFPLPDDWLLGIADVVSSTAAIATGRYKAVNMAGAAVVAALSNAVGQAPFPFVFGGDGAAFAVPPDWAETARRALAETATFVAEEFELELRIACLDIAAVRQAGHDVRVARFAASPDVAYAMFSGGGLAWAETEMKTGRFRLDRAPAGSRPDLTGLSCRFEAAPARRGTVLSLMVRQEPTGDPDAFAQLLRELLGMVDRSPERARPIPAGGPPLGWPPSGLALEARTRRSSGRSLPLARLALLAHSAFSALIFRLGIPVGGFRPARYLGELVANTDYRKYDDGLRMTIDCTPELADAIEARLVTAERDGIARYGLHRQGAALMTCITPTVHRSDHLHFVDGAAGGYAAAAHAFKR